MATAVLSPDVHAFPQMPLPETLKANKGHVPRTQLGWLKPTSLDTPLDEMRQRLEEDEYLYVKGLIPRSDVLKMREHYFSQYAGTSLLKDGAPLVDGIYNSGDEPSLHAGIGAGDPSQQDELRRLTEAHKTEDYLNFVDHPALRKMVRDLMRWDEEVLLRRTMLRHNVPGGEGTGVHYDKLFLRGGDAFFLTAWVPIGDTAFNGGGLIYLQDSVKLGQAIEDDFSERANGFTIEEKTSAFNRNMSDTGLLSNHPGQFEKDHQHIADAAGMPGREYKWLMANYEAGDVVFHHPCSVHASCSNQDAEGRIRLSTDLRFYNKEDFDKGHADTRWMKFWTSGDGL